MSIQWWESYSTVLLILALSLLPFSKVEPRAYWNKGQGGVGISRRELYLHSRRISVAPKPQTLAVLGGNLIQSKRIEFSPQEPSVEKELKYKSLLDCLEYYESRGDDEAYNPHDPVTPSYGCLQFKRVTWKHFGCQGNIWSCRDQRKCANKMIKSDWNNIFLWSTAGRCLSD